MDFARRSYRKELLDRDDIAFEDIRLNMEELNTINTWLGGHRITVSGIKNLLGNRKKISICEIGCGGGDNLLAIDQWAGKKAVEPSFTGIDLHAGCIAVAKSRFNHSSPEFIVSDYRHVAFTAGKPDIIFSALFCHHFTNDELITMLKWMRSNTTTGFFINDLQRHPLAYYSIKILTRLFSRSFLVKNDAPLSVLRGFTKKEWEQLLDNAGILHYSITWKWAFRWLITVKHCRE